MSRSSTASLGADPIKFRTVPVVIAVPFVLVKNTVNGFFEILDNHQAERVSDLVLQHLQTPVVLINQVLSGII